MSSCRVTLSFNLQLSTYYLLMLVTSWRMTSGQENFCNGSAITEDLPQMRSDQRFLPYSLFGVVEHRGRLTSGHYTAFVRVQRRHDQLTMSEALLTPLVSPTPSGWPVSGRDSGRPNNTPPKQRRPHTTVVRPPGSFSHKSLSWDRLSMHQNRSRDDGSTSVTPASQK